MMPRDRYGFSLLHSVSLRVSRDQIDRAYLETWAASLGLVALLEKANA
jgi:hypothetical protein